MILLVSKSQKFEIKFILSPFDRGTKKYLNNISISLVTLPILLPADVSQVRSIYQHLGNSNKFLFATFISKFK